MGEKLFYLFEVCIFSIVALYFIFKHQDILRIIKLAYSSV